MPEGRRPEGTAWRLRDSTEDVKNRGRGAYIVGYSPTRPHIYNIYTTFGGFIMCAELIREYFKILRPMPQSDSHQSVYREGVRSNADGSTF